MTDIAPELWERIDRLYKSGMASNPAISRILTARERNYAIAQKYAIQAGKTASRALKTVLIPDILPDGKMYFNIAERTVRPLLAELYEDVVQFCEEAQIAINDAVGIGMNAIKPELNDSRIVGIIDRMTEAESFSDIAWIMKAPVVNFSQSIVDDSVKANADFQHESGLKPIITRTLAGKACEWCANLAGVYSYPVKNEDVYRRHDNCTCIVEYSPGNGRRQNVWNKSWR